MRELLKAAGQEAPNDVPSLELNTKHPLIERLEDESDEDAFESLAQIILGQARLIEGQLLEDPAKFVQRINSFLL